MRRQQSRNSLILDQFNKGLVAVQAMAVIIGVGVAVWQLAEISSQTRLQSEALRTTQATQSATLILQLRNILDASEYKKITAAVQEHDQKYKLLGNSSGMFRDTEIEHYIGNFEDIGLLVKESPLLSDMAYDHFSYDIEKAWCNQDIQKVIGASRKADKSSTASADAIYGEFESLARHYLEKERQTCSDLDGQ
jgi:arabinogalactan endo-1,4-beta-galactosidase